MKQNNKAWIVLAFLMCCGATGMQAQPTDDRSLSSLEGSGTEESPFLISDADDLRYLQRCMTQYQEITKGKHFRLTADIRLNSQVLDADGSLTADASQLSAWTPMGEGETLRPYYAFQGNFDGNGHTIYGVYINDSTGSDQGLFGFIHREGVVRNLTLADSYIQGTGAVGAIAGHCHEGLIADCESKATVVSAGATLQVGGIAGQMSGSNGQLLRCTNSGRVTGHSIANEYGEKWNCYTGGICGNASQGKVDSCVNAGHVLAEEWGPVGGIAGGVSGGAQVRWGTNKGHVASTAETSIGGIVGSNSQTVLGCRNEGQVVAMAKGSCVGGIAGSMNWNSRIYTSENVADITSAVDSVFVGGIVGNMDGGLSYGTYYTPMVYSCVNRGHIETTATLSQAGGISGRNYCAEIHDSENHGSIASMSYAGGMSPQCAYHSNIKGCSNTGSVTGRSSTGGIVGDTNGDVDDSWNSGRISNVDANSNAGGIAGWTSGAVCGCFNTGEICQAKTLGGIAGYNNYSSVVRECYNAGFVHSDTENASAGGVGGGNGNVSNSYNVGTVAATASGSTVGGVTVNVWVSYDGHGNRSGSMAQNCYNMGRILALGANCQAGNIAGRYELNDAGALFKNCHYQEALIQGSQYTCKDAGNSRLTAIGADDFRTLATQLNARDDWWDDSPAPFVQGYFRPVLHCTRNLVSPHYFQVATLSGDSTLVDLGAPTDNTFFTTDATTGLVLDAYNVLADGHVRRAMLTDAKDFTVGTPFTAQSLSYTRRLPAAHGTACLPFAVSSDDLPVGTRLMQALRLQDNATILMEAVHGVEAGRPFLFTSPDSVGEWNIVKENVEVVAAPINDTPLKGTFSQKSDWTDSCYLPTEEASVCRLATATDTLPPFRAYVQAQGVATGTLLLTDEEYHTTAIAKVTRHPSVTAGRHSLVCKDVQGCDIRVCAPDGTLLYRRQAQAETAVIPLHKSGVYVVTIGEATRKMLVE